MGTGTLIVETRISDEVLPISGARVVIRQNDETLADAITDENGMTEPISIETPDSDRTLAPEIPRPHYAVVDVFVERDGFIANTIQNVQIHDGIESILFVHMTPLAEGLPGERTFDIPPPAVEDPARRVKVGPPDGGAVLVFDDADPAAVPPQLNEVIIPDFITVHLGRPTDTTARNLRVPFAEYIKNVTASEIYPTWPRNSMLANIHAIVTFALNRIYTEWYRSRGFPFEITNSTQFDMAFVPNRDLFSNVNQLVDEYFSVYARRVGHRNPFFTEFCNGTTATCPGMSQWGTVPLAEQGLTPIQILRRFYPPDLRLIEGERFEGITESYPGTPLREGSSGPNVKRMQDFLNRIRINFPLIPQIPNPNGSFGSETTAAVRIFQQVFNLTQDGIIGRATWFRISSIFVAVARLAELTSEGQRYNIGETPPTSVLRLGSRGEDVLQLQFLLSFIAQYFPSVPFVIQDGLFGTQTRDAVIAFQQQFGITVDGIVGPQTWGRLYSVFHSIEREAPPPEPPTPPPPVTPPYPGFLIRNGSRGEEVRLIQARLNRLVGTISGLNRLSEDGIFGPLTQAAVVAFQRHFGLAQDGIVGPITWARLMRESQGLTPPPPPPPPPPTNPPYPGFLIAIGSVGNHVRTIQGRLNRLVGTVSGLNRLNEDGIFGPLTQAAVRAFQRHFGLAQDAIVGPITWERLMRESSR